MRYFSKSLVSKSLDRKFLENRRLDWSRIEEQDARDTFEQIKSYAIESVTYTKQAERLRTSAGNLSEIFRDLLIQIFFNLKCFSSFLTDQYLLMEFEKKAPVIMVGHKRTDSHCQDFEVQ